MEALERILTKVRAKDTISQKSMKCEEKCPICRDSGWVESKSRTYRKCLCAEKHRVKALWIKYGVDTTKVKRISEYMTYDEVTKLAKDKAVEYVVNFKAISKNKNNWFSLLGQPGAGKSHLIMAMGAALLNQGVSVVYMPYTEVMKEIKGYANNQDNYSKLISRYINAEVLIIDDLFKDKVKNGKIIGDLTEVDIKHIYPIINNRYYNNLPTLISSECTPEIFIDLDEAQGGRILEKSMMKVVFTKIIHNYRMKSFEI